MAGEPNTLIVGAGLAGTALAWQLHRRGVPFAIVDAGEPNSSSRIAAGFFNPITGQRLALSWRYRELFECAERFYRQVESDVGRELFVRRPMVRLFQNGLEKERYSRKAADFGDLVGELNPPLLESDFTSDLGGFELPTVAQLNVADFLLESKRHFADRFISATIDTNSIRIENDSVAVHDLGAFRRIVFCQGVAAMQNPLFRDLPFAPAKGEILTLRVPGLREDRIVNRGVWLAPLGNELYRAGSTYDRDNLDSVPTAQGREEIVGRLRAFLRRPFEVVDHVAAIRPILDDRKPLLGLHPHYDSVGFFNGLGSKGSLLAPYFAGQLADYLRGSGALEADVDLRHWKRRA